MWQGLVMLENIVEGNGECLQNCFEFKSKGEEKAISCRGISVAEM